MPKRILPVLLALMAIVGLASTMSVLDWDIHTVRAQNETPTLTPAPSATTAATATTAPAATAPAATATPPTAPTATSVPSLPDLTVGVSANPDPVAAGQVLSY